MVLVRAVTERPMADTAVAALRQHYSANRDAKQPRITRDTHIQWHVLRLPYDPQCWDDRPPIGRKPP